MTSVELDRVSKKFGSFRAVSEISFTIPAGQVVGLLGPNGAGKTTTMRMISGYLPPSAGRVRVCGHDTVDGSTKARMSLGYMPESTPLYPEMRVREYLGYRGRLQGMRRGPRRQAIERVLERCWLTDMQRRRLGTLSKGYKQRVALAAALLHEPPVLILDEPTSGLDPAQIRETRSLIRDLAANRTVIVSSHILPEVEKTCDRIIIIARGQVRADGPARELIAQEATRQGCLLEVPAADAEAAQQAIAGIAGVGGVSRVAAPQAGGVSAESTMPWTMLRVTPAASTQSVDLREPIARALGERRIIARELRAEASTLEALFLRIIENAPEAEAHAPHKPQNKPHP